MQYLFDHCVGALNTFLESLEILEWMEESVDMVYAKPCEDSFPRKPRDQVVTPVEDVEVLDPDGNQFIDAEEAPVVDFFAGNLPEGQAIELVEQKFVENAAARIGTEAVDVFEIPVYMILCAGFLL